LLMRGCLAVHPVLRPLRRLALARLGQQV
jgi:hypothetical protein